MGKKRRGMRAMELERIGNSLVLTDHYSDGTVNRVVRPVREWLAVAEWIVELSDDGPPPAAQGLSGRFTDLRGET